MRIYFILIILLLVLFQNLKLKAQQLPQYSQYILNDFALNPAIATKEKNHWEMKSNNRYQWVGITDAPRTYVLSLCGPLANRKMGLGGTLFTDIVGPTRRVGLNFSYAYELKVSEKYKLSLGISAGMLQYSVDGHKLILQDYSDVVLTNQYKSALLPDFGTGAYFYSEKLFVSLSVPQLYNAQVKFRDTEHSDLSRIRPHFYLFAGYKYTVNDEIQLEPSFMLKWRQPAPAKIDLGLRAIYKGMFWIGSYFRTKDAVSAMLGYIHNEQLMIGYSFDFTTTNLRNYSSGTHEIMLGLRFISPKTNPRTKE